MRKLNPKEVENLRKQLGGDIVVHESPNLDAAFGAEANMADARVPSLDLLKGNSKRGPSSFNAPESDMTIGKARSKKKAASARGSNPGKSDYSVRFSSKNVDRGSKLAIVSAKSKKVVYEQG
jgi:hypothetical protein